MSAWNKELEKFRVDKYDELKAEIADLRSAFKLLHNFIDNRDTEIARLRAALKQVLTCSDIEAAHHIAYKVLGQGALAKEGK